MESPPELRKSTRVKACTECRQQKLRCDAHKDYSKPCSRCSRMNLECAVLKSFRRVKKRTKTELQDELDRLKQQMQTTTDIILSPDRPIAVFPTPLGADFSNNAEMQASPGQVQTYSTESPTVVSSLVPSNPTISPTPVLDGSVRNRSVTNISNPTSPQKLHDLEIGGSQIDDCFRLFLRNYAPQVQVFSSTPEPNTCYSQSPLLFWTIVALGSRKYPKDPTLLSLLAPRVIELAQMAIFSRESTLETIQAFLLLCIWPMPIDTMHKDISPILSGAMLQLATSIGLHVQGVGQDFSRTTVKSDPGEAVSRAKLWVSCLIACQSITCSNGLPPPQIFDTYNFQHGQPDPLVGVPAQLRFQRKLCQILATSATEIAHVALSMEHGGNRIGALTSMINIFSLQLMQLEFECPDKLNYLFLLSVRLHVQCFYFFLPRSDANNKNLIALYMLACTVVDTAVEVDDTEDITSSATALFSKNLHLAAFSVLRISRSHLGQSLDLSKGQKAYFSVIHLHRKMVVQNNDLASRATIIFTQLWTSTEVFKQADGTTDSLTLCCRNRLAMSVVFDCFWRWRREFAGQSNPYERKDGGNSIQSDTQIWPNDLLLGDLDASQYMLSSWSPEGTFPDYDWAASLEFPVDKWATLQAEAESQYYQLIEQPPCDQTAIDQHQN